MSKIPSKMMEISVEMLGIKRFRSQPQALQIWASISSKQKSYKILKKG